jgi:hypothetical protein
MSLRVMIVRKISLFYNYFGTAADQVEVKYIYFVVNTTKLDQDTPMSEEKPKDIAEETEDPRESRDNQE